MRYFEGKISAGFVSLYIAKTIIMISTGLLGIFLPIFLFNLFHQNFKLVILYFGVGYLSYALIVALFARLLNSFGFKRALCFSSFLGAGFYLILYFLNQSNLNFLIPLSIIVLVVYRSIYWTPYKTDFAKFTDSKNRAREWSLVNATRNIIGIFAPLAAGLIITQYSFNLLFIIAILLYLVSFIPYLTLPRTKEKFSWSYREVWQNFFSKKNRNSIFAFISSGAENFAGMVIWPMFIFEILKGSYLKVGLLSTLIIGVTVLFQLVLGREMDKRLSKEKVLKVGSVFYSIGWFVKIFVATAFQIFIIDTYHRVMRIFTRSPFQVLTYEITADQGHYVDEYTVLFEMAINFGKLIMAVFSFLSLYFLPIQWTFILAATASLFLNLLRHKEYYFSRV